MRHATEVGCTHHRTWGTLWIALLTVGICLGPVIAEPDEIAAEIRAARDLERNGKGAEAVAAWRGIIARHADSVEAHRGLQILMRALGQGQEILQQYATLREQNPDSALYAYLHGRMLDGEARRAAFARAVELAPNFFWGQFGLGQDRLAAGDFAAAAEALNRAVVIDPKAADAWVGLGEAQYAANQATAALRSFRQAITLFDMGDAVAGDSSAPHLGTGRCLKSMGLFADALAEAEIVLRQRPGELAALELAVQCCHGAGEFDRGRDFLRRGIAAWRAAREHKSGYRDGFTIDAIAVTGGFVVARQMLSSTPTADDGLRFEVFRSASTTPVAQLRYRSEQGELRESTPGTPAGTPGTLVWTSPAPADYAALRRQVAILAAARLTPR